MMKGSEIWMALDMLRPPLSELSFVSNAAFRAYFNALGWMYEYGGEWNYRPVHYALGAGLVSPSGELHLRKSLPHGCLDELVAADLVELIAAPGQIREGVRPLGLDRILRAPRVPIPRRVRAAVIARDGLVCQLCRGEVEAEDIHLDHILPVAFGGRNHPDNLRVTHSACNLSRPKLSVASHA